MSNQKRSLYSLLDNQLQGCLYLERLLRHKVLTMDQADVNKDCVPPIIDRLFRIEKRLWRIREAMEEYRRSNRYDYIKYEDYQD